MLLLGTMELLFIIGIPVLILIILAVILIAIYNSLVVTEKQVDNSWAQIDVQLKRRADLIPNLVETVKGYAKFEQRVLTEVTKARTAILSAKTPKDAAKGDNMLAGALKTIFVPELCIAREGAKGGCPFFLLSSTTI